MATSICFLFVNYKMITERELKFIGKAIELSQKCLQQNAGGPFGCVVVKGEDVVGIGSNKVTMNNDPTAHAEVVAIRDACNRLGTYQLTGCEIYTSCEPCPMCLGAIYWARPDKVYFANTRHDAAAIDFDDDLIYKEINARMSERKIPFIHLPHPEAKKVFDDWKNWEGKQKY